VEQFIAVTPSDIFNWQGATEPLKSGSERIAAEQKWYALTGRVTELRAEEDGDLHIALADASGDKPGSVVAQIPAKPRRCTFISRAAKIHGIKRTLGARVAE
jgi:hypothetical protein